MIDDPGHLPEHIEQRIESLSQTAAKLGLSEVRTKWRLRRFMSRYYARRSAQGSGGAAFSLIGDWFSALPISMTGVIGASFAIVFIRSYLLQLQGGGAGMSISPQVLYAQGAIYGPAVFSGEWWRLGTAIFLHGGIMHIGFNILALSILGPQMETMLGMGRFLGLFLWTGILGFVATALTGHLSIGGSGSIMGLMGATAVLGHLSGTAHGEQTRNTMLQWFVLTTIFGFFVGADHAAHFGGFAAGAGFAAVFRKSWLRAQRRGFGPALVHTFHSVLALGLVLRALVIF